MKAIEHKLLWSSRYLTEHEFVLKEAERAVAMGGTFKIENKYIDNWYTIITIYYPEKQGVMK